MYLFDLHADAFVPYYSFFRRVSESGLMAVKRVLFGRRVVAVLPFANISNAPTIDPLSKCITDRITNALRRVAGLLVRTVTPSPEFSDMDTHVGELGRRFSADLLVFGSVCESAGTICITVQLLFVTGLCTGSGKYAYPLNAGSRAEEEVADDIAADVRARLEATSRLRTSGIQRAPPRHQSQPSSESGRHGAAAS